MREVIKMEKNNKLYRIFYDEDYCYEIEAPNEDIALAIFEYNCPGAEINRLELYDLA